MKFRECLYLIYKRHSAKNKNKFNLFPAKKIMNWNEKCACVNRVNGVKVFMEMERRKSSTNNRASQRIRMNVWSLIVPIWNIIHSFFFFYSLVFSLSPFHNVDFFRNFRNSIWHKCNTKCKKNILAVSVTQKCKF